MNAPPSAPSVRLLAGVYAGLLALLALSAAAARVSSGPWSLPVALAIAFAKLTLIFTYFMRLRYATGLVRVFALAGFFWLGILFALVFADYASRGWFR